jgi:hypothetical protein
MEGWYVVVGTFPAIYVFDHEDGTYSQYKCFGVVGPIERRGPLKPNVQIAPVLSNKDRRNVKIIEENIHRGSANKRVMKDICTVLGS